MATFFFPFMFKETIYFIVLYVLFRKMMCFFYLRGYIRNFIYIFISYSYTIFPLVAHIFLLFIFCATHLFSLASLQSLQQYERVLLFYVTVQRICYKFFGVFRLGFLVSNTIYKHETIFFCGIFHIFMRFVWSECFCLFICCLGYLCVSQLASIFIRMIKEKGERGVKGKRGRE